MAFTKTLAQRLFSVPKTWNSTLTNCRISSSSSAVQALIPPIATKVAPDPGDDSISRRFLQWRSLFQSAKTAPELRPLPRGDKLLEQLRGMDIGRDRIRLDGLSPPPAPKSTTKGDLTVEDARKLLRASRMEMVKSKLREIRKNNIPLAEFVQICSETCGDVEQGLDFAKKLDESGTVIVLGNVVFLRPDQESETIVAPDLKRV